MRAFRPTWCFEDMKTARHLLLAILPLLGLPAQNHGGVFHMPAGEFSVGQLLDLGEMSARTTILRLPEPELLQQRLRLQTPLALPDGAWQDVMGALLWSQGFVLVEDVANRRFEVASTPPEPQLVLDRARACSLDDLFTRLPFGPVRVAVPTTLPAAMLRSFLAPGLAAQRTFLDLATGEHGVVMTGLGDVVRQAVHSIAGADAQLVARLPEAGGPAPRVDGAIELLAGSYTVQQLVDRLGRELHRNIVLGDGGATVDVADTRRLAAPAFEAAVTAALWSVGILVAPLSLRHGLYEAIPVDGPRASLLARLALPMTVAGLRARPDLVAYTTVRCPLRGDRRGVAAMVRGIAAAGAGRPPAVAIQVAFGPSSLQLTGLTIDLLPLLTRLGEVPAVAEPPSGM